jgi:hypothetical protein
MTSIVYGLCALTALMCACLLLQAWRRSRYRLLLWSGLCFAGLTLNNVAVIVDKFVLAAVDLSLYRTAIALASMIVLLYGLIWESES